MQKIQPHLWFDKEAKEAAAFYASVFPDSRITHTSVITDTPSGDCDIVSFEILGMEFQAISAGPYFKINPSISFMVNFDPSKDPDARTRIDDVWNKLSEGGKALMPIDKYPFSERYGWIEDKFGVSWQLALTDQNGEERPRILPSLLFTQNVNGKTEEATDFYLSVFKNSKRGTLAKYPADTEYNKAGAVMFTDFILENQWFAAMNGGQVHDFTFNEAISFIVNCDTQEELDYYWEKLSAVPEAEQCGWCKDAYGISWQIVPTGMQEFMEGKDKEGVKRATQAMLQMKKLDLQALKNAYEGN